MAERYVDHQQARWEAYLARHGVDKLLRDLTSDLLANEPLDPRSFLIDSLRTGPTANAAGKRRYGWRRDLFDRGVATFDVAALEIGAGKAPESHDLRAAGPTPPLLDQGSVGAGAACAVLTAVAFDAMRRGDAVPDTSCLFLYYNARDLDGAVDADCGATISRAVEALSRFGAPRDAASTGKAQPETAWPFVPGRLFERPALTAYEAAVAMTAEHKKLPKTEAALCRVLFLGLVVTIGFSVYEAFDESASRGGAMAVPEVGERVVGGHGAIVVGYCRRQRHVIVQNSFGSKWGDAGYFYMPWDFFFSEDVDCWVVEAKPNDA